MEDVSDETVWPITCNRYVAYFDIMGFKDMVFRELHNDIYEMMKNIDEKIKFNANIKWGAITSKLVKTTTYSDSIIVYSRDDSYDSLYSLICTTASLTNDLLTDAIPHKGAVAFGMMTLDTVNSIFFGKPLIDAYLLQEELNFYGIIAHASFDQEIIKKEYDKKIFLINKYLCPLKNGNAVHSVIPPSFVISTDTEFQERSDALYSSFNKLRLRTSGALRKYIDNTEWYLNTIKEKFKQFTETKV